MKHLARAEVPMLRQETQYTCCATSIAACLQALGKDLTEQDVNKVLNAGPMRGASWEAMLATVQYFGLRGNLVVPCTVEMLKSWTDKKIPIVIGWNPRNRPWSHASVVLDVTGDPGARMVHIMDPNLPNPSKSELILSEDDFYAKWVEPIGDNLIVRRPAMAVEREVSVGGFQLRASRHAIKTLDLTNKIDARTARAINGVLNRKGLDGNGRFRRAEDGYVIAVDTLRDFGIELDDVVHSENFRLDSNTLNIHLAWTNPDDVFSPISVHNRVLYLYFYKLDNDKYEVLSYLS